MPQTWESQKNRCLWRFLGIPLTLFFLLIPTVNAAADIEFTQIPTQVADALGVTLFAARLMCSSVVLIMFLLPFTLILKGRTTKSWVFELILAFVVMGSLIAVGWLEYWFLLIIAMLIALMYAGRVRDWVSGRG